MDFWLSWRDKEIEYKGDSLAQAGSAWEGVEKYILGAWRTIERWGIFSALAQGDTSYIDFYLQ